MNMTKEYRAELRVLRRNEDKVERDWERLTREHGRRRLALDRELRKGRMRVVRTQGRIKKRIRILEGRL